MSTIDTLVNGAKTDISARIEKLRTDIKALTPTPPPPTTNVLLQDNFDTVYNLTTNGQKSPDGRWQLKYLSGGKVGSDGSTFNMAPSISSGPYTGAGYDTRACEVHSTQVFKDFQLDFDMKTVKQLRNYSGGGAPWEVAWIFFRYTDEAPKSNHHYYFLLRPNSHPEFGKKDNAPGDTSLEQQIYLPRVSEVPQLKIGTSNHITITAKGFKITITVDGIKVVDYQDTPKDPTKMAQGLISFYCEDSSCSWDNIKIVAI